MILNGTDPDADKPVFLRAVELLVAAPQDIQATVDACYDKALNHRANRHLSSDQLRLKTADVIVDRYARTCARIGAFTAASSAIPGIGTVISLVGATAADLVITMKYQIEMVMALAHLFDRDIADEEQQRLCYTIAGLGVATQAGLLTFERFTVKGLQEAAKRLVKGRTRRWLIELFKKIGLRFTRTGLLKAIPLGVGLAFSYTSNRKLTRYIGRRARDYFVEELKHSGADTVHLGADDLGVDPEADA